MIIAYSLGFIFLKSLKTGSTSTEIVMARYCSDEDVLTDLPPPDQALRREIAGRSMQNNDISLPVRVLGRLRGWDRDRRNHKFHHNISAKELRGRLPEETWQRLKKVTIARNPFDRAISKFYHDQTMKEKRGRRAQGDSKDEINEYLLQLPDSELTNWHIYSDETGPLADEILRYENLGLEVDRFLRSVGIENPVALPMAKGGFRTNRTPYQSIIGQELRSKIENVAGPEIDLMGYHWA